MGEGLFEEEKILYNGRSEKGREYYGIALGALC